MRAGGSADKQPQTGPALRVHRPAPRETTAQQHPRSLPTYPVSAVSSKLRETQPSPQTLVWEGAPSLS